ncbi:MAG: FtsW/RodA/SpoVE family cell cycle protein [Pontiellaceae bacterium]|nr:FtsW/RodA/SpoVE family cell cycle protein [Pontiellaceae bacterium]
MACVFALLLIGLVMRVSRVVATHANEATMERVFIETAPAVAGCLLLFGLACVPAGRLRRISPFVVLAGLVILLSALFPGMHFPSSEIALLLVVLFLAWWLTKLHYPEVTDAQHRIPFRQFLVAMVFIGLEMTLLLLQPDYHTGLIVGITALLILFRADWYWSSIIVCAYTPVLMFPFLVKPQRWIRLLDFYSSRPDKSVPAWDLGSLLANSGWTGAGLGSSRNFGNFPDDATGSFIASLIGEELGGIALLGILAILILLVTALVQLARKTADPFGSWLASGVATWITALSLIHFAVLAQWLPLRAVPLPFVSAQPVTLCALMAAIGMVLSATALPRKDTP